MGEKTQSVLLNPTVGEQARQLVGPMTLQRAGILSVSEAGQTALRIALEHETSEQTDMTVDDVASSVPDDPILIGLYGYGGERGVVAMDQSLLAAVLQAQTVGVVTGAEVAPRKPTQTDAVMCRRFLAMLLHGIETRLQIEGHTPWAGACRPRDLISDAKQLPHILPNLPMTFLRITVNIGKGVRNGTIAIALPAVEDAPQIEEEPDPVRSKSWSKSLEGAVMESPTTLSAVLYRFQMTLQELMALKPGDEITIPISALDHVRLETPGDILVGEVWVGQKDGARAVQFPGGDTDGPSIDPFFASPLDEDVDVPDIQELMDRLPEGVGVEDLDLAPPDPSFQTLEEDSN